MITITIIFALLVALWGFSGTIASVVRRGLTHAEPRPARAHRGGSRAHAPRSVASAGR